MKRVIVLGSTGSVGTQTLDVIKNNLDKFEVVCLTCKKNIDLLEQQINLFKPKLAVVEDESKAEELKKRIHQTSTEILSGYDNIVNCTEYYKADIVVAAIVGIACLMPVVKAIENKVNIALANKETLVAAGTYINKIAERENVNIIPVDSEHSAIFQCLQGNNREHIKNILLTASGGPFRGFNKKQLEDVTVNQALKHPNWDMGDKITIDSATMMNKGLEVIEASYLFGLTSDKIKVIIHPESVIHSMVEYSDNSIIAQLSIPDMRIPIMYALSYPDRLENKEQGINFFEYGKLTFEEPDFEAFRCLKLSYQALDIGHTMPAVLNAANEVAVNLFLNEQIKFTQIGEIIEKTMLEHQIIYDPDLDDILNVDKMVRNALS